MSLVTLGLATIGAYAKPTVHPGGGLEPFPPTPAHKVASASDLRVAATVKNAGDKYLKILKLGSVLDTEHPTRAFIVKKDGKEGPFTGTTYPTPTDGLSENDWVVIPAGKDVTAKHDVSALYDFSTSGPGTFSFDPVSRFQVIGLDDSVETASHATPIDIVGARSVSITITDVSKRELAVDCAIPERVSFIESSIAEAKLMANASATHIKNLGADDQLYKDYFGNNPPSDVAHKFNLIFNSDSPDVNLRCANPDYDALVAFNRAGTPDIFYCNLFWTQRRLRSLCNGGTTATTRNLRGGTTLRMLARTLVPGVAGQDRTCEESRGLSDFDKITNNDNYECFAAEVHTKGCQEGVLGG